MFSSESCLHALFRLAHGTKQLAQQMAYWFCIDRSIHSMCIMNEPIVNERGCLIDGYVNEAIIKQHRLQFDHTFAITFSSRPNDSIIFRSRFKIGKIVYHSLSYTLAKQSSSYNVCISNCNCMKGKCFGKIVFFFPIKTNFFFFFLFILVVNLLIFPLIFKEMKTYLVGTNVLTLTIFLLIQI